MLLLKLSCNTLMRLAKLPVRRKSHPSASRTHESIKKDIEAFALVFPSIEFSVMSEADNDQKKTIICIPKVS